MKTKILSEEDENPHVFMQYFGKRMDRFFELGAEPEYLPDPSNAIAARAQREGRDAYDLLYDVLLGDDGHALIYLPIANFTDPTGATILRMITHPNTAPALGDGGAHVGTICDASVSTYLLTEWVRRRGEISLESAIHKLTRKPADMFRLKDRGTLGVGMKADLNVIDLDNLVITPPRMSYDLPAGGKRLLQGSRGYRASVLSGQVSYRDGVATKTLNGKLVRGAMRAA